LPGTPRPRCQPRGRPKATQVQPDLDDDVPGGHIVTARNTAQLRKRRRYLAAQLSPLLIHLSNLTPQDVDQCQSPGAKLGVVRGTLPFAGHCKRRHLPPPRSQRQDRKCVRGSLASNQRIQHSTRTLAKHVRYHGREFDPGVFQHLTIRGFWLAYASTPRATRVRVRVRQARIWGGGTKLGWINPCARRSAIQVAAFWTVFLPGRGRTSRPLATTTAPLSLRP
jgi:hypothetical protein